MFDLTFEWKCFKDFSHHLRSISELSGQSWVSCPGEAKRTLKFRVANGAIVKLNYGCQAICLLFWTHCRLSSMDLKLEGQLNVACAGWISLIGFSTMIFHISKILSFHINLANFWLNKKEANQMGAFQTVLNRDGFMNQSNGSFSNNFSNQFG